jgi:hypothetical protein
VTQQDHTVKKADSARRCPARRGSVLWRSRRKAARPREVAVVVAGGKWRNRVTTGVLIRVAARASGRGWWCLGVRTATGTWHASSGGGRARTPKTTGTVGCAVGGGLERREARARVLKGSSCFGPAGARSWTYGGRWASGLPWQLGPGGEMRCWTCGSAWACGRMRKGAGQG